MKSFRRSFLFFILLFSFTSASSYAVPNEGGDEGQTSTGYRTAASVGPGEQGLNGGAATVLPDVFTGTLSTSIPIDVPPGRNGLAPALRLTYNSSGGNGWIGLGWELEVGAIERDTKGGVDYDANDYVFRMNGSRVDLINTGGDEYRAKIEGAFTKIRKVGDYWEATDKTGRRYFFGQTTASRQDNVVTNRRGEVLGIQTFKWCLDRVEDPNGNYMTLSYFKDTAQTSGGGGGGGGSGGGGGGTGGGGGSGGGSNGAIYLARIDYTGNGSLAPTNAVVFHLEGRNDPSDLYVPDFLVRTSYRLKSIEITANGTLMRVYQLTYLDTNTPPRSLLSSVQQFGKDTVLGSNGVVISGSSLPATSLAYTTALNSFGDSPVWLNKLNPDGSATYNQRDEYTGDFNGDGRTDWMYLSGDGWYVALSIGGRFAAPVKWLDRVSTHGFRTFSHVLDHDDGTPVNTQFPGDFNGDGKTDWMYLRTLCTSPFGGLTEDPTLCTPSTYIEGGWYVALSTGTGFATPTLWLRMYVPNLDYPTWNRVANDNGYLAGHQFPVDVNGDGKADWMWNTTAGWYVALSTSTGNKFATPTLWLPNDGPTGPTYNSGGYQFTGDFNGDGKTDFMYNRSGWYVAISHGNGFDPPRLWLSNDGPGVVTYNLSLEFATDLNGDGKTDWMYKGRDQSVTSTDGSGTGGIGDIKPGDWYVALSTGSGFTYPRFWLAGEGPGGLTGNSGPNKSLGDFNGDGKTDMMYLRQKQVDASGNIIPGTGFWYVVLSTGNAFTYPTAWLPQLDTEGHCTCNAGEQSVGDFNGDGKSDWLYLNATGWHVATSYPMANLLANVANGLGGTTTITYRPSTVYTNTNLPFPVQTVSSVTTDDGRGTISTMTYSYAGGYAYRPEKDFRGFAQATVVGPSGSNGERTITMTSFHQGNDTAVDANDPNVPVGNMKGKPYRIRVTDGQGKLYSEVTTAYMADDTAPYFNPPVQVDSSVCDAGPCTKQTRVVYAYDQYGNVTREDQHGDLSVTSDDRTIIKTFSPNVTDWIVGMPVTEAIYEGIGTANKVAGTDFYYDGVTDCDQVSTNQTPTKGNLTRVVRWLSGGESPETRMAYDSFGNLICTRDGNGNPPTTISYDSSSTFPTIKTALDGHTSHIHRTITQYYGIDSVPTDFGIYGQVRSVTDSNNQTALTRYDVFGRKTQVTNPDGGITMTAYLDIGTAGLQRIRTTTSDGTADGLWSETYFDGLGQTYMARTEGPVAGKVIRQDTVYDQRGKVIQGSLPYFEGSETPRYTTSAYDPVGRTVQTIAPDGTVATAKYAGWSVTTTDPNGHQLKETKDAAGRIVQVDEYWDNSTAPYATTTYKYDVLGNLLQVLDAQDHPTTMSYDTLSRKIAMNDPDMGHWSYQYDTNGNLKSQTDAKSQSTTFFYDAFNRVTKKVLADNTQVIYTYDSSIPNGIDRLASVQDSSGTTSFQYDPMGRVIQSTKVLGNTSYTTKTVYDTLGRITSLTYPKQSSGSVATIVSYTYNPAGWLNTITDGTTVHANYPPEEYTAMSQPKVIRYNNEKIETRYTYRSDSNRLQSLTTTKRSDNATYQDLEYTYDNVGNITFIEDSVHGDRSFAYDPLNRLTQGTYGATSTSPATTYFYGYDTIGNMTSKSQGAPSRLEETSSSITYLSPPAAPTVVDDSSSAISYENRIDGWNIKTDSLASGGGYAFSSSQGDSSTLIFTGTGVQWLATKSTEGGIAQVYLDGILRQGVDLYCATCGGSGGGGGGGSSGTALYQQVVWSASGLSNTSHLVEVIVTGSRNASSSGSKVNVDAFVVTTPTGTSRIEESSPAVALAKHTDTVWSNKGHSSASGGGYATTSDQNAIVTFPFTGTAIKWLAVKSSEGLKIDVYLDGLYHQTVDLNTGTGDIGGGGGSGGSGGGGQGQTQFQQLVFSRTDLAPGLHFLKLVVSSGQSGDSKLCGSCVGGFTVDAFDVLPAGQTAWVRSEESSLAIDFGSQSTSGTKWSTVTNASAFGGKYHIASTTSSNGTQASYSFSGYTVTWLALKNSSGGIAQVYLDGVLQGTVDLYSATAQYQQTVWSKTNLANTQHILTIVVTGTKSAASSGTNVYLDGFWVYNAKGWQAFPDPSASGSSIMTTDLKDSTATLTFTGTGVSWLAATDPTGGTAEVLLDNGTAQSIIFKAPTTRSQQVVYTVSGLANTSHTLKIRMTSSGTTSSPSRVTIDAFDIVGALTTNVPCTYNDPAHVHAVKSCGNETFTYDANGNMTQRSGTPSGTQTYAWDAQNRLKSAVAGGITTSFIYDGDGGRVKKTVQTNNMISTTTYIGKLYECTQSGCALYIFAGDQRIAIKQEGSTQVHYYHTDHLNSTTVVTDKDGNRVQALTYEPYGKTKEAVGPADVHHKYTGQELDDSTGLYHYGARYYDAALGRFISADTIVPNPADPQTLNRYSYVRNNPLLYIDPSGHIFGIDDAIFITVVVMSAAVGAVQAGINSQWDAQAMLTGAAIGAVSAAVGMGVGAYVSGAVVAAGWGTTAGGILGAGAGGLAGGTTSGVLYRAAGYDVNIGLAALAGLGGGLAGGIGNYIGGSALGIVAGGAAGTAISGGDFGEGFIIGIAAAAITASIVNSLPSEAPKSGGKQGSYNGQGGAIRTSGDNINKIQYQECEVGFCSNVNVKANPGKSGLSGFITSPGYDTKILTIINGSVPDSHWGFQNVSAGGSGDYVGGNVDLGSCCYGKIIVVGPNGNVGVHTFIYGVPEGGLPFYIESIIPRRLDF